ncbi:DNA-binding protein [Pseudomonas helleri]|uniref:KfrA N-terminal DNA-binding domain-containing protein n=2 Tax=Pseudomonas TaxID=286 RepID=A0A7X2BVR5_9PSED|nr:DNA-binding protein [Pseudomonas helleri]MQT76928.1 hypothetical protein [Pseudomonas helleri]MQT97706.1 hypothetical protein [Pseudomonas helleri]MQU33477.1 hypothetical protein [Pseudomonas helleri]
MSRLEITQERVQLAQQALVARGVYPSADAVHKELGNVGAKSTIEHHMRALYVQAHNGQAPDPATAVPVETLDLARLIFSAQLLDRIADLRSAVHFQTHSREIVEHQNSELQKKMRESENKLRESECDRRELLVTVAAQRELLAESRAKVRLLEEEILFTRQSLRGLEAARDAQLQEFRSLQESLAAVNAENCVLGERLKRACAETRMTRRQLHH